MGKILLRGLLAVAPLAITIVLLVWIYNELESIFGKAIIYFIGPEYYFPGLGVLLALVCIFFIGLLFNYWIIQNLYNWFENKIKKIPLIKTIYNSVTDLMSFFSSGNKKAEGSVVKVDFGGVELIGFVTRETFNDLPKNLGSEDQVAVFFPFSYQIGGFTAMVSKSRLIKVDMPVEQGIRFVITAANPSANKSSYTPSKPKKSN